MKRKSSKANKPIKTKNIVIDMLVNKSVAVFNETAYYYQNGILFYVNTNIHKIANKRQIRSFADGIDCSLVTLCTEWKEINPIELIKLEQSGVEKEGRYLALVNGVFLNQETVLKQSDLQENWFIMRIQ